jgi:hypothetical protein
MEIDTSGSVVVRGRGLCEGHLLPPSTPNDTLTHTPSQEANHIPGTTPKRASGHSEPAAHNRHHARLTRSLRWSEVLRLKADSGPLAGRATTGTGASSLGGFCATTGRGVDAAGGEAERDAWPDWHCRSRPYRLCLTFGSASDRPHSRLPALSDPFDSRRTLHTLGGPGFVDHQWRETCVTICGLVRPCCGGRALSQHR